MRFEQNCLRTGALGILNEVEKGLVEEEKDAIRQYSEKFGECRDGTDAGLSKKYGTDIERHKRRVWLCWVNQVVAVGIDLDPNCPLYHELIA